SSRTVCGARRPTQPTGARCAADNRPSRGEIAKGEDTMENLATLVLLAVLCEAVVELVKGTAADGFAFPQLAALRFGQAVAWGVGVDLFALAGITGERWLGYVGTALAGLVVSRGAGYVHALADRLATVRSP